MPDTAAEPLIADEDREVLRDGGERARLHDGSNYGEHEEEEADESQLVAPGQFIWILTVCAGVSGLLFGYEYAPPLVYSFNFLYRGSGMDSESCVD